MPNPHELKNSGTKLVSSILGFVVLELSQLEPLSIWFQELFFSNTTDPEKYSEIYEIQ